MPSQDIISLSEREALIRATPAFRDLNVNEISQLASIMQEVDVLAGETVVREGELIDAVFIIASGNLEVTLQVELDGKTGRTFLTILNPGDSIGLKDFGMFTKTGRRSATVTAQSASVLLKIALKDFDNFLEQHPQALQSMRQSTDTMLRMQLIKESNPFANLSNQRIAWLAGSVKNIEVNKGDFLFKQNDTVDNCYMIVDGVVEITTQESDGTNKVIAVLKPGQLFGEQALFKGTRRSTTAQASTDCSLMVLDQDTLEELQENTQEISEKLFSQSSEYNRPKRLDNIIYHQRTLDDGQVITTLKDPVHNRYLQLNDEGWHIWQMLNGQLTVKDITQRFSKYYNRFDPQIVITTLDKFIESGFAKADVMQSDAMVLSKQKALEPKPFFDRFQWFYSVKHPDSKITKLYKYFGFIFYFIPSILVILACTIAGFVFFPDILHDTLQMVQKHENFYVVIVWIMFLTATFRLINPIAKAFTVKYFGHSIPHFAIGFNFIFPVVYVDTSDLWASSRFQRAMTHASGILGTLFIASALTLFVYFNRSSVFAFTAGMCALFLYFLALRSLDPLLDSDGYQTLVNALDAQRLRENALSSIRQQQNLQKDPRRSELNFKHRTIFFIYYFIYIILNVLLIYLLQHLLFPFGLEYLWNSGLVYILLLLALFIELIIEISNQKKLQQILAAE